MEFDEIRVDSSALATEFEQRRAPGTDKSPSEETYEADDEVEACFLDGALTLGDKDRKYVTKHAVDYTAQNSRINDYIIGREYLPCCRGAEGGPGAGGWLTWNVLAVLRNEMSLYCLHLIVISLGVIKESVVVNGGETTSEARLIYTSIETTSTAVLIFMRTINAWISYSSAGAEIDGLGFVHAFGRIAVSLSLLRYFRLFLVAAGGLLVVCTVSFVVCLTVDQLEWTVLSNIVSIITINLLATLFAVRVTQTLCWVRLDAHRVVVLEAVTLLKSVTEPGREACRERGKATRKRPTQGFLDAVESTQMLRAPDYVYSVHKAPGIR